MKCYFSAAARLRTEHKCVVLRLARVIDWHHRQVVPSQAVHEMRSSLTQIRASLRVLRDCFGDSAYHRYNKTVRNAARDLNAARDAAVLIETARRLRRGSDRSSVRQFMSHLVKRLSAERHGLGRVGVAMLRHWSPLRGTLRGIQRTPRCQFQEISADGGIVRAYRRSRSAYARAARKPTDARLHEWRKQVKYLYCETVAQARPVLQTLHRQANDLAQYLGEDHDLAVLQVKLLELHRRGILKGELKGARTLIMGRLQQRRMRLQRKAHRLGVQCYRRKAKDLRDPAFAPSDSQRWLMSASG